MNRLQEDPGRKSNIAIGLEKVLEIGLVFFIAVGICYGDSKLRDICILLAVLWFVGLLVQRNIIHYVWGERAYTLLSILMCVGGPILALVLLGQFLRWW